MSETIYTQEDLEKLKRAMLRGERSVTFSDGRRADFADAEDLARRIEYVRRELASDSSRQTLLGEFSKGVQC